MPENKVAVVLFGTPEGNPFVQYYIDFFKQFDIDYDLIFWNRSGKGYFFCSKNTYVFEKPSDISINSVIKSFHHIQFARFVKKICLQNQYSHVIVFTLQAILFLYGFLKKYSGKILIDIRDYSRVYRLPGARQRLLNIINKTDSLVVSSPRFMDFLPENKKFYVSHNVSINNLKYIPSVPKEMALPIRILTIGKIRDTTCNIEIINIFKNNPKYNLHFAGDGYALPAIKEYIEENHIINILFSGLYKKKDEGAIVAGCDIINAFMPDDYNSSMLLSNRLYLSIIYGKPIIVNKDSYQGELVTKYNLGFAISTKDENILQHFEEFLSAFDNEKFQRGRSEIIEIIRKDYTDWERMLTQFLSS